MTEEELNNALQKAKLGDREAFASLYNHFFERIYRFIYFRVGHKEIAEDVLADTFVKAWLKLNQISASKALSGWLYRIAKNNIIDYYRVRKNNISLEEIEDVFLEEAVSPIDAVDLNLDQKKLLNLVEQLPTEQQQVLKYKFFEDLSNEEIAFVMNKTAGAVRVIQHRAIIRLKQLYRTKKSK